MENSYDREIKTRIPQSLYDKFMFKLADDRLSYHSWLIKMINEYVNGGDKNAK